ncbi:MAG: hypothetical protein LUO89_12660, partial [Methanothrix sp.]|nr:hypothetical protein [Methanothrix sp.]
MKILFISSSNMIAANLAYLLRKEGHEVKLFIDDKYRQGNFENMVGKTYSWRKELNWVGKEGLIVFDDIGYGKIQDQLRKIGYSVFGGCELGDRLETDRQHAKEIFRKYKIKTLPTINFNNISDCTDFIKRNRRAWVIKQNDHAPKMMNYVSMFEDSRDAIGILESYSKNARDQLMTITVQQKVEGV